MCNVFYWLIAACCERALESMKHWEFLDWLSDCWVSFHKSCPPFDDYHCGCAYDLEWSSHCDYTFKSSTGHDFVFIFVL